MAKAEEVLTAAARICFAAGEHRDFRGFDTLCAELGRRKGPEAEAWLAALRAVRWSFEPTSVPAPAVIDVRRFVGQPESVRQIATRACAVMERVSVATFDAPRLAEWVSAHSALAGADGAGDDVALGTARLWHRLLVGDATGPDTAAKALFDEASRQRAAPQVIESTVLRALLALSVGATDDALELARRASRMAQSEALPQHEYLANTTLARVRRYSGRPHLALHILAALLRVAPPAWWGWIGWEMLLGGGGPEQGLGIPPTTATPDPPLGETPAMVAARDLRALIAATHDGERGRYSAAASRLEKSSAAWPDLAREVQTLLAALDPEREPIPDVASAWCRGQTATIPCGLHGIGVPQGTGPETEGATAFVVASPKTPGRRFLRPGLAFAGGLQPLARDSAKAAGGGVRTETGIAALALAGEAGMTREAFFNSVYGFPFVAHRHQAVLDVLCHRMRNLLGDVGEIRRDAGESVSAVAAAGAAIAVTARPPGPSLSLILSQPIVVSDMRCALPTADRVLRALATLGTTSASAAADSLRMPLRTVQSVLQQLVAEGACSIERDGRRVAYKIEDTTFTEVTTQAGGPLADGASPPPRTTPG